MQPRPPWSGCTFPGCPACGYSSVTTSITAVSPAISYNVLQAGTHQEDDDSDEAHTHDTGCPPPAGARQVPAGPQDPRRARGTGQPCRAGERVRGGRPGL